MDRSKRFSTIYGSSSSFIHILELLPPICTLNHRSFLSVSALISSHIFPIFFSSRRQAGNTPSLGSPISFASLVVLLSRLVCVLDTLPPTSASNYTTTLSSLSMIIKGAIHGFISVLPSPFPISILHRRTRCPSSYLSSRTTVSYYFAAFVPSSLLVVVNMRATSPNFPPDPLSLPLPFPSLNSTTPR